MKRKTVKTAFKNFGLFHYLNEIQELPFVDEFSADNLDILYLSSFGKKSVSDFVLDNTEGNDIAEKDIKQMVTIIHSMYYSKWNRLYSIMLSDLKILENRIDTTKEVINDVGENVADMETKNINESVSKISPYNSDDFVNKDSDDKTETRKDSQKGTNKNERVREVTKTGFTGSAIKEYQNAIDYLKSNLIYDIIFKDINTLITLQIYE